MAIRPDQLLEKSAVDHQTILSLYGLIVEPGTMARCGPSRILTPTDDDLAADFYELAMGMLAEAGWIHYEIANWASSPHAVSRHNAVYWRNGDYAGIGAGAHGHVRNRRTMNQPSPGATSPPSSARVGRDERRGT